MPGGQKTLIIVNPVSGGGRAREAVPCLAAYLRGQEFGADFTESRTPGDIERLAAEAVASGYECVVAMGGDGTFQQVVRGTLGSSVLLGVIPAGSGNDIAAALGIPPDPIDAAHALLHSQPRAMDVVRTRAAHSREGLYLGGGGLGLDAAAAQMANGRFRRLPGAARYIAAALWALTTFESLAVHLELEGAPAVETGPALLVAAANTPTYGAGVRIAPQAEVDDGLLDIVVVGKLSWTELLEIIPEMLRTGNVRRPELQRYRARRVTLRTKRSSVFHGDGEVLGETPVELEVLPGAIRVLAPRQIPTAP